MPIDTSSVMPFDGSKVSSTEKKKLYFNILQVLLYNFTNISLSADLRVKQMKGIFDYNYWYMYNNETHLNISNKKVKLQN